MAKEQYRAHRINSNKRRTEGGKGDLNRSDPTKLGEGMDRVFPDRKEWYEDRDMSWLEEEEGDTNDHPTER